MKKIYTIALTATLSFSGLTAWGQGVGVNTDNSSPDASAMLDVKSTNKGVLIPRMTTAQRTAIAAPAQGLLVFDQTTNGFWYYDGASWQPFVAGADQDNQTLTYSGSTLTISNGNTVTVPNGDVTAVTAGTGLTGGGTAGSFTINAVGDNGLTTNADDIDLGGTLNRLTTITQGANNMIFNLSGTGDFHIQDNGTNQFSVLDNGDVNADANTFFVDASANRVGVLTTTPDEALDVNGDIVLSGGVRHIETQAADQNIEIDDANPTWAGETYGGVTRFYGDGNLSRSKLEGGSLQLERRLQIKGGNPGAGKVLTSDANGLASWETPAGGAAAGIWSTVAANTHYEIASFALDAEIRYGDSDLNGNSFNSGNGVFWGTNPGEDTGIFTDGDQLILISPGDNDLIQFWEEDAHVKRAYIEQAGGQYFQTSDRNLKQNIQPISNALSMVMQLNGYRYEHKLSEGDIAKGDKPVPTIGIMAQEVAAVAPELAKKCDQGHYLVNYSGLIPLLIEATKTQENRLQEQEQQLKSQAEQLAEQAEMIQAMRAELDAMKAKQQD